MRARSWYRALTEAEVAELQRIGADSPAGLRPVVRRLLGDGVSAAAIGRALGRGGAWMTRWFPQS